MTTLQTINYSGLKGIAGEGDENALKQTQGIDAEAKGIIRTLEMEKGSYLFKTEPGHPIASLDPMKPRNKKLLESRRTWIPEGKVFGPDYLHDGTPRAKVGYGEMMNASLMTGTKYGLRNGEHSEITKSIVDLSKGSKTVAFEDLEKEDLLEEDTVRAAAHEGKYGLELMTEETSELSKDPSYSDPRAVPVQPHRIFGGNYAWDLDPNWKR